MTLIHFIGNVAIWVGLASAVMFCGLYSTVPWRHTPEGWHLMSMTFTLGGVFGWLAYRTVASPSPPTRVSIEVPRALVLTVLAGLLVWRLVLLLRAQLARGPR